MLILSGKVVLGGGRGREFGYPTANLDRRQYARLPRKPRLGIHAGIAKIDGVKRTYKAAIVIGPRDKSGLPKIEAHLLGFTGVLYGKCVTLSFRKHLRRFMSYREVGVLKRQVEKDIKRVARIVNLTE